MARERESNQPDIEMVIQAVANTVRENPESLQRDHPIIHTAKDTLGEQTVEMIALVIRENSTVNKK